jgi:Cu/Ag efflux protein CusF
MKNLYFNSFRQVKWPAPVLGLALLAACGNQTTPAGPVSGAPPAATPLITASQPPAQPSTEVKLYKSAGVIIKTDPSYPSVELDHEEIKGLMPAMKMEFYVKDKAMLNGLKPGDKVDFTLQDTGGQEVISELKKK